MVLPDAYPPVNGFTRNVEQSISLGDIGCGLESGGGIVYHFYPSSVQGMWDPLINALCSNEGYQLGDDLLLFNYDWRKELNPDRPLPDTPTTTVARLDSLINDVVNVHPRPGADRLTIISHSMGGLVVQAYLRRFRNTHHVFRWITLGTPFQGTVDAFSALFSANPGPIGSLNKWRIMALHYAREVGDMVQEFVPVWEMLPTPYFDTHAPGAPGVWEGHGVYAELGLQPWPLRRVSHPIVAGNQYSCQQVKQNDCLDCWRGLWRHNGYSRQYCSRYQSDYMDMNPENRIDNVDTWLIACPNRLTLRGVAHYEKWPATWGNPFSSIFYYSDKYDINFCGGDGVVPTWSATTANVDTTRLHVRYCDDIAHRDLVRDADLAAYVADIAMDKPLGWYDSQFPGDPDLINNSDNDNERAWSIEYRNDVAVWIPPGKKDYEELPVYPVALELADRNTGQVLVWIMQVSDPHTGETATVPVILDDRFVGYAFGNQITLASNHMGAMALRLIIRPSPELFPPAGAPADKAGAIPEDAVFTVLGQLSIYTNMFDWRFPDPDTGTEDYIEFNRLGYGNVHMGFQAYVDFDIVGGAVSQHELELHVDSDGDGEEDYIVTQVGSGEGSPGGLLTAEPNPFNPVTTLHWAMPSGSQEGTLLIYDVSGHIVYRRDRLAGSRGRLRWTGQDMQGKRVSSGMYIAVLVDRSGHRLDSCKLVLMK